MRVKADSPAALPTADDLQQRVEISTSKKTPGLTVSAGQCTPADMIAFLAGLPLVSRPIIVKWFRQNPKTETKTDLSPVTITDRLVETALRAAITQRFPQIKSVAKNSGPMIEGIQIKGPPALIDGSLIRLMALKHLSVASLPLEHLLAYFRMMCRLQALWIYLFLMNVISA